MLCSICKKNTAKVHLTQIIEEKMHKVDLCEECAREKGVNDPTGFSLADLLLGLGASQEIEKSAPADGVELRCPACGFTQTDFKKTGRLGCGECYHTFAESLAQLLKSMHKGVRHVGKTPQAVRSRKELADTLKTLGRRLEHAITAENYEEAALLRDQINQLRERTAGAT